MSTHTDQVFINTHSSVFVADNYPHQTIFKVEKNNGATSIEEVTEIEKPNVVFELLGGSPADLLLPRNLLIVEGQSEFELLTRVISRFYAHQPPIQIIKANGDIDQTIRTINSIEKTFIPLGASIYREKTIILIDQPSEQTQAGVTNFLRTYDYLSRNNQFFQLPARDIEQCYPDQEDSVYDNWRKTQAQLDATNENNVKIFTSKRKTKLAKHVGNNISQQQFETDLDVCHNALLRCWDLAY